MALSDSQLMMLEQLTYLTDSVYKNAGTSKTDNPKTVRELMSAFMDENGELDLSALDGPKANSGDLTKGSQWAGIIRQIANDESLMNLEIGASYCNSDGATVATCYSDPETGKAYVTFHGTTGSEEWADNVDGLYQSDTKCQKEALAYIESLPFDDITVTGHSKGGNKAMYVTLLSDKVTKCVAMDGQGFSKEFYDKYWAEVQKKGGLITNYSVDDDYVNILLSPVPNSNQIHCEGYNEGGVNNHSPSSYFQFEENENGEHVLVVHEDGSIVIEAPQNGGMTYLHEFTMFVMNVMPYEDRKYMAEYLSILLAVAMTGEYAGKKYTQQELLDYIMSDKKAISILMAYLIKYIDTYHLDAEDLLALLESMGLSHLADALVDAAQDLLDDKNLGFLKAFADDFDDVIDVINAIIKLMALNLGDDNDDFIVKWLLEKIIGKLASEYGIDTGEMWDKIEDEYTDIGHVDPSTANNNITTKTGKVRNFSKQYYDVLMSAAKQFKQSEIEKVNPWKSFNLTSWFMSLKVNLVIEIINSYADRINDVNDECKIRIQKVFEDVQQADKKSVPAMNLHKTYLENEINQLRLIGFRINPQIVTFR